MSNRNEPTPVILYRGDEEISLPCRFEVCPRCQGRGSHVNPNIDGHGLTAEDFAEAGDEFREDYFNGVYDIACDRCYGARVVSVPDESRISEKDLADYQQQEYEAACERDFEMVPAQYHDTVRHLIRQGIYAGYGAGSAAAFEAINK